MRKLSIKKDVLEEVLHELVSLQGFQAFDVNGDGVVMDNKITVVPSEDLVDLNFKRLIILLEVALGKENPHVDCEYYNIDSDSCYNYIMGKYTGLAFDVSRHNKCIEDIVKDD